MKISNDTRKAAQVWVPRIRNVLMLVATVVYYAAR